MNIRNIALVTAVVAVAGIANAQAFELRAGANATLSGNTFTVGLPGSTFSVEIWATPAAALSGITSVSMALAYDTTTSTATTGLGPTGTNGALSATAAGLVLENIGLGAVGSTVIRAGAAPTGTANIQTGTNRALVVGRQFSAGTGSPISISAPIKLATMTFTSNIANNDVYGDGAGEIGLQMYFASAGGSSQGGTSAIGPTPAGPGQTGSQKYNVRAVPEPATMAALGAGLAFLARRRKK